MLDAERFADAVQKAVGGKPTGDLFSLIYVFLSPSLSLNAEVSLRHWTNNGFKAVFRTAQDFDALFRFALGTETDSLFRSRTQALLGIGARIHSHQLIMCFIEQPYLLHSRTINTSDISLPLGRLCGKRNHAHEETTSFQSPRFSFNYREGQGYGDFSKEGNDIHSRRFYGRTVLHSNGEGAAECRIGRRQGSDACHFGRRRFLWRGWSGWTTFTHVISNRSDRLRPSACRKEGNVQAMSLEPKLSAMFV